MNKVNWQGEKTADCTALLNYIYWHGRFGLYDKIDIMLYNIDLEASELMMTGFLRYTFMIYKHTKHLPSWPIARDKVYEELIRRGEPVEQVESELQGLMDQ